MLRTIAACAAGVAATLAIVSVTAANSATSSSSIAPACPRPVYAVDGNMGPLFCIVDNPLALHYFASIGRHTFALGPDAPPSKVVAAVEADFKHGTIPIMCSVYRLAAWRNQWHFSALSVIPAVAADLHLIPRWCSDPRFNVAS